MCVPVAAPSLIDTPAEIRSIDQLRQYIHVALCRRENLLENHFPMTEIELFRNGTRCGLQFMLHGPRAVRLGAVWAEPTNEILLYDATGKRYARVRLPNRFAT